MHPWNRQTKARSGAHHLLDCAASSRTRTGNAIRTCSRPKLSVKGVQVRCGALEPFCLQVLGALYCSRCRGLRGGLVRVWQAFDPLVLISCGQGFGVWGVGSEVWVLEFRVQREGFGEWGVGSEVEGLELSVSGLGSVGRGCWTSRASSSVSASSMLCFFFLLSGFGA